MHGSYENGFMMSGMWFWWVLAAAGLALLVWAISRLTSTSVSRIESPVESSKAVLGRRYPAGESGRDVYVSHSEHLKSWTRARERTPLTNGRPK